MPHLYIYHGVGVFYVRPHQEICFSSPHTLIFGQNTKTKLKHEKTSASSSHHAQTLTAPTSRQLDEAAIATPLLFLGKGSPLVSLLNLLD